MPEQFNVDEINNQKSILLGIDKQIQSIILKETESIATNPLTLRKIMTACKKSSVYHTEEANKIGFINEIRRPRLPESGVVYITDEFLLKN